MTRGQEIGTIGDHLGAVAGVRQAAGAQIGIALFRHVEAVTAGAAQGPVVPLEWLPANRAPQVRQCAIDHGKSFLSFSRVVGRPVGQALTLL
ncbi:hypothetical protein Acy02nite_42550 [Actinoplanes cyaneus]|uniref:Uncharacterized protein n=1 Tax=Actinoplanes cyaneus TaxID=52696 RepID=A0A919IIG9_9ACTN|nr:hypothetical protein Acy02nite_42550 [Actinoplanes cyaneus]